MKNLFAGVVALIAVLSISAGAQEKTLRAERTVDFETGRAQTLNVTVGPVRVESVEFSDLGKGYARGGKPSNLIGRVAGANESEASTTLRARFMAENPTVDDWVVRFTLELLDKERRRDREGEQERRVGRPRQTLQSRAPDSFVRRADDREGSHRLRGEARLRR